MSFTREGMSVARCLTCGVSTFLASVNSWGVTPRLSTSASVVESTRMAASVFSLATVTATVYCSSEP